LGGFWQRGGIQGGEFINKKTPPLPAAVLYLYLPISPSPLGEGFRVRSVPLLRERDLG